MLISCCAVSKLQELLCWLGKQSFLHFKQFRATVNLMRNGFIESDSTRLNLTPNDRLIKYIKMVLEVNVNIAASQLDSIYT